MKPATFRKPVAVMPSSNDARWIFIDVPGDNSGTSIALPPTDAEVPHVLQRGLGRVLGRQSATARRGARILHTLFDRPAAADRHRNRWSRLWQKPGAGTDHRPDS